MELGVDLWLSYVFFIILTSHDLPEMNSEKILFSLLPTEYMTEYDSFLRKERKAVSTDVIRVGSENDRLKSKSNMLWKHIPCRKE